MINFRILATAAQRAEIERDFRSMIQALDGALEADFELIPGTRIDPELAKVWADLFDEQPATEGEDAPEGAELRVSVRSYTLGSISSLTMNFGELLTTREKPPAEPLLRQVQDDPGTPRVPWFVEVRA